MHMKKVKKQRIIISVEENKKTITKIVSQF